MRNQVVSNRGFTWRPASYAPKNPFNVERLMGQVGATGGSNALLDDPVLAATFDVVAAGTAAYVAYGMYKAHSPWLPLWLTLGTAMGVKALHDFSRIKT